MPFALHHSRSSVVQNFSSDAGTGSLIAGRARSIRRNAAKALTRAVASEYYEDGTSNPSSRRQSADVNVHDLSSVKGEIAIAWQMGKFCQSLGNDAVQTS